MDFRTELKEYCERLKIYTAVVAAPIPFSKKNPKTFYNTENAPIHIRVYDIFFLF